MLLVTFRRRPACNGKVNPFGNLNSLVVCEYINGWDLPRNAASSLIVLYIILKIFVELHHLYLKGIVNITEPPDSFW